MENFTKLELEAMEHFKKAVLDYCESNKIWNAELIFSFEIQRSSISNSSFNTCEFTADEIPYCLTEIRPDTMYALYRNKQLFAQRPTVSECLDFLIEKLTETKSTEPTIHFDKKVIESGLTFKEAYMRMVEGKKISRPCFMGWWFMNHESKVIIHDRYDNELKEGDITNTVTNTLANDWEVIE